MIGSLVRFADSASGGVVTVAVGGVGSQPSQEEYQPHHPYANKKRPSHPDNDPSPLGFKERADGDVTLVTRLIEHNEVGYEIYTHYEGGTEGVSDIRAGIHAVREKRCILKEDWLIKHGVDSLEELKSLSLISNVDNVGYTTQVSATQDDHQKNTTKHE
ncbi:hypothetical protein Pcinc_029359 [Petrolisthes cinctipes]|uniref:Uncharacterized protein n=1 Tax=Petrolisthes cinctipes TaxID=88211 RepID=A0AAE1F116_PETCI|nr:hypothetical protein Pcinc_029359 [Petrolisthes cinctipes]